MLKKLKTISLFSSLLLLSKLASASSITSGLSGIGTKLQVVADTMCGPIAFILSCGALLAAAAAWKFAGHSQGMKIAAGAVAGMIIIANIVGWVTYFTGAII